MQTFMQRYFKKENHRLKTIIENEAKKSLTKY